MAEAGTLVQSTGGCPQSCAGVGATFSCASRTGDAIIRGYSKCANFNSGDWNERKRSRINHTLSASELLCGVSYDDLPNCNAQTNPNGFVRRWYLTQPYSELLPGVAEDLQVFTKEDGCGNTETTDDFATSHSGGLCGGLSGQSCISDEVETVTISEGALGCVSSGCFTGGSRRIRYTGFSVVSTLTRAGVYDTVHTAMVRDAASSGTLCRTQAGTITSTGKFSNASIIIQSTTTVRATISLTGLTVSQAYNITANINRYTAGGGGFVDTVQAVINFTADGASDTVDYDVPMNTDFDYEFASIASVVAA